jgi:hypothetical protein
MPRTIRNKRSKRDRRIFVDKWLAENGLTRDKIQSQAHLDGMGTLGERDYYDMAVGHRKEIRPLG